MLLLAFLKDILNMNLIQKEVLKRLWNNSSPIIKMMKHVGMR